MPGPTHRTERLPVRRARGHALALFLSAATLAAQSTGRWIEDGPGRGLPRPEATWTPWHASSDHPANRVFRSLFVVRLQPAEVGRALPREQRVGEPFYVAGWYFEKRAGTPADVRWFGGDALQLPRESFSPDEAAQLQKDLDAIDGDVLAELKRTPRLAIWLQNDLLRMARRLVDTKANPELLGDLLRAAERLALPRAVLADPTTSNFSLDALQQVEPAIAPGRLVELDRRSTQLFDAERTMLWSKVYVQWPVGKKGGIDAHLAEAKAAQDSGEKRPEVPLQTRAVLVQGLVALADDGTAVATPVVVDVRLQHSSGAEPLSPENPTTTRDGNDFRIFWLERQVARERGAELGLSDFRELKAEDEVLFRDYGQLKHTTVRGQCALCHRRSETPEPELSGFPVLRPASNPRRAPDAGTRLRLAEQEFTDFVTTLRDLAK